MTAAACTKEQYELEQEFQPLFDFLAQEKKDFSKVSVYKSSIYITNNETEAEKEYSVSFEKLPNNTSGIYSITENDQKTDYPVSLDDNGELTYPDAVPEAFDTAVFNLTFEKGFFQSLPISDYLAEHPETYLKDITYDLDDKSSYFSPIKKKYNLSDNATLFLRAKQLYGNNKNLIYNIRIIMEDKKQTFDFINTVSFQN
ncbi:hypothetical protein DDV22_11245 [Streptococcus chenjunshii]|nr:hypothetical protein DDV22_11245 [Streptococcus chenjunshii]